MPNEELSCITIRFPTDLYQGIRKLAKAEMRSINAQIIFMIQSGMVSYTPRGLGVSGENIELILENLQKGMEENV